MPHRPGHAMTVPEFAVTMNWEDRKPPSDDGVEDEGSVADGTAGSATDEGTVKGRR